MKNIYLLIITLFVLGNLSCSTVKETSSTSTSDKTKINYSKTISSEQANNIVQLLRNELSDFPKQSLPIRYTNKTEHSTLDIRLKERKIKFNYRSDLNLKEGNREVVVMQQLKEKLAGL